MRTRSKSPTTSAGSIRLLRLSRPTLMLRRGWTSLRHTEAPAGHTSNRECGRERGTDGHPVPDCASTQPDRVFDLTITTKGLGVAGFTPIPQRWKDERRIGWTSRSRRLVLDYETNPRSAKSQVYCSFWLGSPLPVVINFRKLPFI